MSDVSISLKIADFDIGIDVLSSLLGLTATDAFLKGQKYNLKTQTGTIEKIYPNSFWEYRIKLKTDEWVQSLIDKFIDEIISVRKDVLKELGNKYYLELFVSVIYSNEINPSFHFNKEKIKLLSNIGFELDIDQYIN